MTDIANLGLVGSSTTTRNQQFITQDMGFGSLIDSLLSSARSGTLSSGDSRLSLVTAQSKMFKQNTLFNMFSTEGSKKPGLGLSSMGSTSGLFSLPSWAYDVQRVMGNEQVDGLMNMYDQASALYQSRLNSTPSLSQLI